MSRPMTLAEYLVSRAGLWRGADLLAWLGEWALAMKANGWQTISMDQYAAYAHVSRAAGYRRLTKWRRFVEAHPNEVVEALRAEYLRLLDDADDAQVYATLSGALLPADLVAA